MAKDVCCSTIDRLGMFVVMGDFFCISYPLFLCFRKQHDFYWINKNKTISVVLLSVTWSLLCFFSLQTQTNRLIQKFRKNSILCKSKMISDSSRRFYTRFSSFMWILKMNHLGFVVYIWRKLDGMKWNLVDKKLDPFRVPIMVFLCSV